MCENLQSGRFSFVLAVKQICVANTVCNFRHDHNKGGGKMTSARLANYPEFELFSMCSCAVYLYVLIFSGIPPLK